MDDTARQERGSLRLRPSLRKPSCSVVPCSFAYRLFSGGGDVVSICGHVSSGWRRHDNGLREGEGEGCDGRCGHGKMVERGGLLDLRGGLRLRLHPFLPLGNSQVTCCFYFSACLVASSFWSCSCFPFLSLPPSYLPNLTYSVCLSGCDCQLALSLPLPPPLPPLLPPPPLRPCAAYRAIIVYPIHPTTPPYSSNLASRTVTARSTLVTHN